MSRHTQWTAAPKAIALGVRVAERSGLPRLVNTLPRLLIRSPLAQCHLVASPTRARLACARLPRPRRARGDMFVYFFVFLELSWYSYYISFYLLVFLALECLGPIGTFTHRMFTIVVWAFHRWTAIRSPGGFRWNKEQIQHGGVDF